MLTRFTITARRPVLDGKSFGTIGPYEQLEASANFEIDPDQWHNKPIVDLEWAPRNAAGRVECRADIWLMMPVEPERGNGNLLHYVLNRGRKGVLSTFNLATASNQPMVAAEFGDGFLMDKGYTVAACAWQADVPPEAPDNPHLMTMEAPVACFPQGPITGPVSCEILVDELTHYHSLGSRYHRPYAVADGTAQSAWLSVRKRPYEEFTQIARSEWSFTNLADGRPAIYYPTGFIPGLIYNLVYTAKDPVVMGMGFAAVRDFVSFIKYDVLNPTAQEGRLTIQRAYAFGSSQSGRFLRHLLYQGFNEDEAGRQVLDGLIANVAGASRGSFNHRFAQPSRHASAHFDAFYPTELFPFTDALQDDPQTQETGALLACCETRGTTPKIFYVNTSTEYWNRSASLSHTDVDAKVDVELPAMVRIYHFAGTQHGPAPLPTAATALPGNPVDFRLGHRALLVALDQWVKSGVEPPASCYGRLTTGSLVDPSSSAFCFPVLPLLTQPQVYRQPCRLDWGEEWVAGIIAYEPPLVGHKYSVRVPAVDVDGNEVAGIRLPEVAVPLGTFTGWRLRLPEQGATWALVGLEGVWLPLAPTAALAAAQGDTRIAVTERYKGRKDYIDRCIAVGRALVDARVLLDRDMGLVGERAGYMYDWVMGQRKE